MNLRSAFLALVAMAVSAGCSVAFADDENGKSKGTVRQSHLSGSELAVSATQSHYTTVPVFYVTDRARTKNGYGPQRKIEHLDSIEDLHYGSLDYSLKTDRPLNESQQQLGWREYQSKPQQVMVTKPLSKIHSYHDFWQVVGDAAKKANTKDIFVMVHGFNTPFASAARNAALLSLSVQRPVVLFSWPSKGKLSQYDVDLGNNEWSQEHFDGLSEEFSHLKETSGLECTLVAHSMGNRIAVRSTPVLRGKHVFKQIFLVDPDFDAETFVHYLVRYAEKNIEQTSDQASDAGGTEAVKPTRVRILFSHKDHALPLSEFLFGGYTRLGQAADTLLSTVVTPFAVPAMLGDVLSGTSASEEETSKKDESDVTIKKANWIVNFEWVDFTVLDHGMLGHTVPFDLIANLWSTDQPGSGLKLVHSDNGSPNRLAGLFLHLFSETNHISSKIYDSERVVLTGDGKNKR